MDFVNSPVGILEAAVHGADQHSKKKKKNSHTVKVMAFLCDGV